MTLGWFIVVCLLVLGTLCYLIKDEDYENWKKNNDH